MIDFTLCAHNSTKLVNNITSNFLLIKMPLTTAQVTNFFTQANQMSLTAAQRTALANEGLTTPEDFRDFKREELLAAGHRLSLEQPESLTSSDGPGRLLLSQCREAFRSVSSRVGDHARQSATRPSVKKSRPHAQTAKKKKH